jgi:hypothetical protein
LPDARSRTCSSATSRQGGSAAGDQGLVRQTFPEREPARAGRRDRGAGRPGRLRTERVVRRPSASTPTPTARCWSAATGCPAATPSASAARAWPFFRGPQAGGARPVPVHPGKCGHLGLPPPQSLRGGQWTQGALHRAGIRGQARHQHPDPGKAGQLPQRRHPAEGGAGQMAHHPGRIFIFDETPRASTWAPRAASTASWTSWWAWGPASS